MSIISLKNGLKNTTPRALEACCEHKYSSAARHAAYPVLLVPSHGNGRVDTPDLIFNQGLSLYSGNFSYLEDLETG